MVNKTKIIFTSIAFCFAFLFLAVKISANGCTPISGGGETCPVKGDIMIDKKVKKADAEIYVDNLTQNDAKYKANQEVSFKIIVKNNGGETIDEIIVKDLLPDYLSFVSGPGSFDKGESKNGTLTFRLNNLAPQEQREFFITGKVLDNNSLPDNVTCDLTNRAQGRAYQDRFGEDFSRYCIEKPVNPPSVNKGGVPPVTPKTGPIDTAFVTGILSAFAGIGLYLRKKSSDIIR